MTILITGATGTIGKYLVRSLVEEYKAPAIRLLVRDVDKAKNLFAGLNGSTTIEYVQGDVTNIRQSTDAFTGIDRLFVLTVSVPTQKQTEQELVTFATEVNPGLKQIVRLSAIGVDLNADTNSLFRWHAEAEQAVVAIAQQKNVALTILKPNLFLQNFLRDDAASIKEKGVIYRLGPPDSIDYRISHIDVRDIATAAAVVLTEDVQKHRGSTYNISGPEALTFTQVTERITKAIGKEVKLVPVDDYTLFQSFTAFINPSTAFVFVKLYQYYKLNTTAAITYGDFKILTGKDPRSVEQFFQDHKNTFI